VRVAVTSGDAASFDEAADNSVLTTDASTAALFPGLETIGGDGWGTCFDLRVRVAIGARATKSFDAAADDGAFATEASVGAVLSDLSTEGRMGSGKRGDLRMRRAGAVWVGEVEAILINNCA